ncbi:MAG: 2'-5' RNA ligase family protein [Candidatus Mcinerneyibacterium aminivorans]|uniref:2'-5' RNA ligase family protein n=1 Tax=Candidatus Mcinerneyibacterium aminivorans TaxID=2703815 RepID=A0A5D0MKT8_9BACT|nr:MAG: 2'-5' RNA ligase family protein [Candidatus Mcinerneyibacterium aminivorans]
MAYRIELVFNEKGSNRIKSYWEMLKENKLNSYMIDSKSTPHISLAEYSDILAGRFEDEIRRFSRLIKPFEVRFFGFGYFPTEERVLYLNPKVSKYLLRVHNDFNQQFVDFNDNINPYYLPENWVPHSTLGKNFSEEDLKKSLIELSKDFKPFAVEVNRISVVEFYPSRELFTFKLSKF